MEREYTEQELEASNDQLPRLVINLVTYLTTDVSLDTEGLLRIQASGRQVKELRAALDKCGIPSTIINLMLLYKRLFDIYWIVHLRSSTGSSSG